MFSGLLHSLKFATEEAKSSLHWLTWWLNSSHLIFQGDENETRRHWWRMSDKTYHSEAGKGCHRRKEDKQKFEKNFDGIDWSVKSKSSDELVEESNSKLQVNSLAQVGSTLGALSISGTIDVDFKFAVDKDGNAVKEGDDD